MLCNSAFVAVSATELSVDLRSNPQLIRFTCTGSMPSQLKNLESLDTLHDYPIVCKVGLGPKKLGIPILNFHLIIQSGLFNRRVCLSVSHNSYPLERTKTDPEEHRKYQTNSAGCNDDSKNVIDGRDDDTDHSGLICSAQ